MLGLIAGLRGETTVLFSTHVLADVERICDRVGILDHGRLVVEGPLGDLLDRYALPVWRIEAEPGQDAAVEALAARLRELAWVTAVGVEHGLLTVAVADPCHGGAGAAAGRRSGRISPSSRSPAPGRPSRTCSCGSRASRQEAAA